MTVFRLAICATVLGLALAISPHMVAAEKTATLATRPVVVELFTSQGCSSCPPADALLAELARRPDLIALGYHVDYWDNLGWKDPLSAPGSTERQNEYARLLSQPTVYTPQMVIDGHLQMVGSDRDAVLDGIAQAAPTTAAPILFAVDRRQVTVAAGSGSGKVLLIRFRRNQETAVTSGENTGRAARDVNGVTGIMTLGLWQGQELHFTIEPPAADEGVAVLVQAADGHMLGAAATQ